MLTIMTFMGKDLETCVETICSFPTLYNSTHKAPIDIVKGSGYKELSKMVTVELIARYLTQQQNMIDTWIQFSEDIRHSPAWGFRHDENNNWTVVYSDENGQTIKPLTFANKIDACARMVKETIDGILMR